jgi:4-amino-4-deoxy-L-arabinose transferase-like glycosyltransferase
MVPHATGAPPAPEDGVRPVALWLGLLVVGQAASLRLMKAGNLIGYQHYRLTERDAGTLIASLVLLAQLVIVLWGLRREWPLISAWMRRALHPLAWLLCLGAFVVFSATLSKDVTFFVAEVVVASLIQVAALGNVVLLVRALSPSRLGRAGALLERIVGPPDESTPRPPRVFDRFAVPLAVSVVVIASLLAVFSYQRHPHVPDELVYLIQARYLAEGVLTLPAPPVPSAFNVDLMFYEADRWFSPVPPGWPFALAIGAFFGVPWLVNPVLGGVNLLLAHAVLGEIYPRRTARLATVFLAFSPWFLFMAMNFMTHTLTLFFALLAALAVARARRAERPRPFVMFAGGLAIGAVSLVRPLEGLAVAIILGLWSLPPRWWDLVRRVRIAPFLGAFALALGAMASGLLVRPYNKLLTGSGSYFPIMAYIDKYYTKGSNDLGFGENRGLGWSGLDPFPGHGPIDVVVNAMLNIAAINVELLGWGAGSLVAMLFLIGSRRVSRQDWGMLFAFVVVVGLHSLYWFSGGPDFGARYWYLVIVPCVALVARGVVALGESLASPSSGSVAPQVTQGATRATLGALALTAVAVITFVPWRAVDKYHHYRRMRPDVRELAKERNFGRSLVLVRGRRHPDYASAAAYNPLDLRADAPLYAWDVSPEVRAEVVRAYADRPVWILEGPTVTGDGFRVVEGPLRAEDVLGRAASQ